MYVDEKSTIPTNQDGGEAGVPVEEAIEQYVVPDKYKNYRMFSWGLRHRPHLRTVIQRVVRQAGSSAKLFLATAEFAVGRLRKLRRCPI